MSDPQERIAALKRRLDTAGINMPRRDGAESISDQFREDFWFLLDLLASRAEDSARESPSGNSDPAVKYADRVLRFAATVPCLHDLLGEDDEDGSCECYGCAGRRYVAIDAARSIRGAAPMSELAWLIEDRFGAADGTIPGWWAGVDRWTADANAAVRFARQQDAERVLASLPQTEPPPKVMPHMWEVPDWKKGPSPYEAKGPGSLPPHW